MTKTEELQVEIKQLGEMVKQLIENKPNSDAIDLILEEVRSRNKAIKSIIAKKP